MIRSENRHDRLLGGVAAGLLTLATWALHAAAAPAPPARVEIPIEEVRLSTGVLRYGVDLRVNGHDMRAGLDTGSTGLRVLERAVGADAASKELGSDSYSYGSGTQLEGPVARAAISFGGASGEAPIQVVRDIGCTAAQRHCSASHIAITDFGIQGDGLKGEGFPAILGINTAEAKTANPFIAIGVHRWIVELPRPGEGTGRLVLNPTSDELTGFARLGMSPGARSFRGGLHDSVPGCLVDDRTKARVCGTVMFDTGAPGIRVINARHNEAAWQGGDTAVLALGNAGGPPRVTEAFTINSRAHASRLTFGDRPQPPLPAIFVGLLPYFAFSVLYDADSQEIGLRARPPVSGGPVGEVAATP